MAPSDTKASGRQRSGQSVTPAGISRCEGVCRNGKGRYWALDGSTFDGHWKQNKKDGFGILNFSDGASYVGQWKAALKHGHGVYTSAEGASYK